MYKPAKLRKGDELDTALRPWTARAANLVSSRLRNAQAHAGDDNDELAASRLFELHQALVNHVSEARGTFYRRAFAHHRRDLDPEIHQVDLGPTAEGEDVARQARILGRDFGTDVAELLKQAGAHLALASAEVRRRNRSHTQAMALDTWFATNRDRLTSRARRELSNSQMALHHAIGHLLLKPELRD